MKYSIVTAVAASLLLGAMHATAACTTPPPSQNVMKSDRFWTCIFDDVKVATVSVRLDTVTSVAMHTYNIGAQTVREVTIDTTGNNSIRIYCLNTNSTVTRYADRVKNTRELVDSKTGGATKYPSKTFPEGTYSHNIEYQVESVKDLEGIYESVIKAVFSNKGAVIEVK